MDPEENLKEQLELANKLQKMNWHMADEDFFFHEGELEEFAQDAARLSELVQALDRWIRSGGFLPAAWERGVKRAAERGK